MTNLVNVDLATKEKSIKPAVSVIITSYNYGQLIRECIKPLLNQKSSFPFEIIMVDTSTDCSYQIVSNEYPEIRLFHLNERKYVGEARNFGVDKAEGEFIVFLDQDCIAPPDWLEKMYRVFNTTGADAVGGAIENGTPESISGTVGYYLEFFRFIPDFTNGFKGKPRASVFLVGGNSGFRKEVFKAVRYYDNYDKTKFGEDIYFNWQLSKLGKKLVFEPSVYVKHMNKKGLLTVFRYQFKIGLSACAYRNHVSPQIMQLFLKFPYLSFILPFLVIPWIGFYIASRAGIGEFIKFILITPLLFIGNCVWATGFIEQCKKINKNKV